MVNGRGFHDLHLRKRVHIKKEKYPHPDKFKRFFDSFIYVVAVVGIVANLPQLLKIWVDKTAQGVSLISWASFAVISSMWMIYGFLHKEKVIIFMNIGLIIIDILIVTGVVLYG